MIVQKDFQRLVASSCINGNFTALKCITQSKYVLIREIQSVNLMTGLNALGYAVCYGQIDLVKELIEIYNCDMLTQNEWKMTPLLSMACHPVDQNKDLEVAHLNILFLFFKLAKQQEESRIAQMRTVNIPLRQNIQSSDQFPFIRYRLLYTRNHIAIGGNTIAHLSAVHNKRYLMEGLHKLGMNLDCVNNESATPLHLACICGNDTIVNFLLEKNVNVNAKTSRGETPLMHACYSLNLNVVKRLVSSPSINYFDVAEVTGLNNLHCLVLGLTRTHRCMYLESDKTLNDPLRIQLYGTNFKTKDILYDSSTGYLSSPPAGYITLYSYIAESPNIFLFPDELEKRLNNFELILNCLNDYMSPETLNTRSKNGYTPAELLQHRTEFLIHEQQDAWSRPDPSLATLNESERLTILNRWKIFFEKIDLILYRMTSSFNQEKCVQDSLT